MSNVTRNPIVPRPREVVDVGGEYTLWPETHIMVDGSFLSEATYLAEKLRAATGYPFPIVEANSIGTKWLIRLVQELRMDEANGAYVLDVTPCEIFIKAASPAGIFWGIQSLLQLLPPAIYSAKPRLDACWRLPRVLVKDAPRFSWRGAMLDSARHFLPVDS